MSKIYCSNCGKLISKNNNYCQYCGAAQHGPEAAVYRAEMPALEHPTVPTPETLNKPPAKSKKALKYIPRNRLCPEVIVAFFINYLGRTAVLLVLILIGMFFEPVIFSIMFGVYLLVLYITAWAIYNNFYFSVDENGFQKEYGIIHKNHVSIPYQQIQNVNITRSLTDRVLGLAKISIETAGSSSPHKHNVAGGGQTYAEGHLPGVTMPQAKQVHDLLLHKTMGEV